MKSRIIPIFISIVLASCSAEPEPLAFVKDACYTCKITLMDNKYGAEIVTKKGKVYKFDDVNCLMNFYKSKYEPVENIAHVLVIDFSDPEHLINALDAHFVQSEHVRSPMASNVAAFNSMESLNKFNSDWKGKELKWSDLQETLK